MATASPTSCERLRLFASQRQNGRWLFLRVSFLLEYCGFLSISVAPARLGFINRHYNALDFDFRSLALSLSIATRSLQSPYKSARSRLGDIAPDVPRARARFQLAASNLLGLSGLLHADVLGTHTSPATKQKQQHYNRQTNLIGAGAEKQTAFSSYCLLLLPLPPVARLVNAYDYIVLCIAVAQSVLESLARATTNLIRAPDLLTCNCFQILNLGDLNETMSDMWFDA